MLKKAILIIDKEMEDRGFINDSDMTDRFLDNLAIKLAEEEILKGNNDLDFYYEKENDIKVLEVELLENIKEYMNKNYKFVSKCGCKWEGFYYNKDKNFKIIEELEDYFS